MKLIRLAWALPLSFIVLLTAIVVFAQTPYPQLLILTGGGFNQPQDSFYNALSTRATQFDSSVIQILVLPVGIGSNPNSITDGERTAQLVTAEQQRQEIEANCQAFAPQNVTCTAILVPVITHNDALASPALEEFASQPGGIFFLQNKARAILEIIRGTDLEQEIVKAYQSGTVVVGPGDLFSTRVIYGFRPKFGVSRAMNFGAVLISDSADEGGMAIFPETAVLDTHPFSENRFGSLLNAITGPEDPHIGIGIEANAGIELIEDNLLSGVFGDSLVVILDAESYQAANALTYQPGTHLIGIRNVLLQLIEPGSTSYDLGQRQNSRDPVKSSIGRSFEDLHPPPGAGTILLASDLITDASAAENLIEFTNLSGGQNAHLLIVTTGYADLQDAESEAAQIATKLAVPSDTLFVSPDAEDPVRIEPYITGIILTGPDPSLVSLEALQEITTSWLSGLPVLADRAGAAILGSQFPSALLPDEDLPLLSTGRYTFQSGLGFVQANIIPNAFETYSWERILNSASQFPMQLAIGIAPGAAIKFENDTVEIIGTNVISLVDFRTAALTTSEAGLIGIANGLLDIYAPGEQVKTLMADAEAAFIHAPTPVLAEVIETPIQAFNPTPTATSIVEEIQPEPTEAPPGRPPTRTPRPTGTPVPTPPASDPGTTNLMVFFGVLSVVVVIVGVWLNRQATNE